MSAEVLSRLNKQPSTRKQASRRPYVMRRRADLVDATRERITAAAMRLHTSVGPSGASIAAIAAEAGVTRLTVYNHFAGPGRDLRRVHGALGGPPPAARRGGLAVGDRPRGAGTTRPARALRLVRRHRRGPLPDPSRHRPRPPKRSHGDRGDRNAHRGRPRRRHGRGARGAPACPRRGGPPRRGGRRGDRSSSSTASRGTRPSRSASGSSSRRPTAARLAVTPAGRKSRTDPRMGGPSKGSGVGAPGGIRTHDPQLRKLVLYPLSYGRQ